MQAKVRKYYEKLTLKCKLIVLFIILSILPTLIMSSIYYNVASQSILEIAKKNILNVTIKNTKIIDEQFRAIQNSAININVDQELYEVIKDVASVKESELLKKDRKVQTILKRYFPQEYIFTATIMTPRYVFGNNAELVISTSNFFDSPIYKTVQETKGEAHWIPTYLVKQEYNLDFPATEQTIFSLVQVLNLVSIDPEEPNNIQYLEEGEEAVLCLNLNEDFIKEKFESGSLVEGAFYCIASSEGEIIAHTDEKKHGTKEALPWIQEATKMNNGSILLKYEDKDVVVCFAVSEVTGWISAVVTPVDTLLNNVSKLEIIVIISWLILLVIAICVATLFARQITQPIEHLVKAMKKMGEGNFNFRLQKSGAYELQYLTDKYNEIGSKLQILIEENYKSKIREKEAEVMALNLQMNPHFLYNTLNIINMMALEKEDAEISKMIISLSDMLQYTFRNKQELVIFEEEYLWLKNYIYIMMIRFEDKFEVYYEVSPEILQCKIPKLLLQPLVENAIVHGFKSIKYKGILTIRAYKIREYLYIEVEDNGNGMNAKQQEEAMKGESKRIGLSSAVRRLDLLYGPKAQVEIHSPLTAGVCIQLKIPL